MRQMRDRAELSETIDATAETWGLIDLSVPRSQGPLVLIRSTEMGLGDQWGV